MSKSKSVKFSEVNPNAAGIDIGSRENWASVGEGSDDVRKFGVFTEEHHNICLLYTSDAADD